jgi:hypothetical protein
MGWGLRLAKPIQKFGKIPEFEAISKYPARIVGLSARF